MKKDRKRGIKMPTRIIFSALLLLIQIGFIVNVIYDFSINSAWAYSLSMILGVIAVIIIVTACRSFAVKGEHHPPLRGPPSSSTSS